MVAYSFKARFVDKILHGHKRQTIRANGRRRHARPGEKLQLYTGMRTKHCSLIIERTCKAQKPILIRFSRSGIAEIVIDNLALEWSHTVLETASSLDEFARLDGFDDAGDMARFWFAEHKGCEIFDGTLITWEKDFDDA